MKLGIIGHPRTIGIIRDIIRQIDKDIVAIPCVMDSMDLDRAISFIKTGEEHLDGILFTGRIPYDLVNTAIFSHKPWTCAYVDKAQLLQTLIQAFAARKLDIRRISLDSCDEDMVFSACASFGYREEELDLRFYRGDIYSAGFLDDLADFHENNIRVNGSDFCMTGVSSVNEKLEERGIPCFMLDPTPDSVRSALSLLSGKQRSRLREDSRMVVLSIEQDLPNEYALVRENEYLLALETMKITEEVYLFAQRIQAAVVEREFGKFLLFTTRNLLEFETGNLQQLSLLKPQSGLRFGTLSVGIGYGETAREAKYNAGLGLLRAKKNGGSQAFKVENNAYFGPIQPEAPSGTDQQKALQIDGQFQKIADTAGISLNSVLKLQWIIDREKTDSFTARELAGHFGVSQRSMHRLVEKLEHAGFLRIVGRNVRTAKGRPSRIVQLDLKSKAMNGRV